jgi:hypothetical protein
MPITDVDEALRRARRPLTELPPTDPDWRKGIATLLAAEVRHATEDFWASAHRLGAGLLFDGYHREREADRFRFLHEVRAREAWRWLSDLNMHEGDRNGPWSRWEHFDEAQRALWRQRWFCLARGFLKRLRDYEAARRACYDLRAAA